MIWSCYSIVKILKILPILQIYRVSYTTKKEEIKYRIKKQIEKRKKGTKREKIKNDLIMLEI